MSGKGNLAKPKDAETKKEKLLGQKKRMPTWKIIAIIIALAAGPVYWLVVKGDPAAESSGIIATQVMEKVSYKGQSVPMVNVTAAVQKGVIELPLDLVKKDKLVYFEYQRPDSKIPLLAYISPGGKLVTAVSVCEPCNSTRFHIEGNQMVCNSCFTRWDLETLKGISGGCLKYPPDTIPNEVQAGKVRIKESDIQSWKPRIVRG